MGVGEDLFANQRHRGAAEQSTLLGDLGVGYFLYGHPPCLTQVVVQTDKVPFAYHRVGTDGEYIGIHHIGFFGCNLEQVVPATEYLCDQTEALRVQESLAVDYGAAAAYGLESAVEVEHRAHGIGVVLDQLYRYDGLVWEKFAEEVYSPCIGSGRLEGRIILLKVGAYEKNIVI